MFKVVRLAFMLSPLLLGGCAVGDGVAHVVKLVGNKSAESGPPPAARPAAAPTTAERDSPPPAAAAPRDEITVETLPPRS